MKKQTNNLIFMCEKNVSHIQIMLGNNSRISPMPKYAEKVFT